MDSEETLKVEYSPNEMEFFNVIKKTNDTFIKMVDILDNKMNLEAEGNMELSDILIDLDALLGILCVTGVSMNDTIRDLYGYDISALNNIYGEYITKANDFLQDAYSNDNFEDNIENSIEYN